MDPLGLHVSFHWTAWKLETSPFCCPAPTDAPSLGDHWLYLALVKRACDQQAIPTFNDLQGHVARSLCSWHVYRFCNKKLRVAIAWVFALKRVVGWGHQCREDSIGGRQHPHQSALECLGKRSTPSTIQSNPGPAYIYCSDTGHGYGYGPEWIKIINQVNGVTLKMTNQPNDVAMSGCFVAMLVPFLLVKEPLWWECLPSTSTSHILLVILSSYSINKPFDIPINNYCSHIHIQEKSMNISSITPWSSFIISPKIIQPAIPLPKPFRTPRRCKTSVP